MFFEDYGILPRVQGKADEFALKKGGFTSHVTGEINSVIFVFRSHLEIETFTNGGGKTSRNPLIIFTFGDCREETRQGKKDFMCTIYKCHSLRACSCPDLAQASFKLR